MQQCRLGGRHPFSRETRPDPRSGTARRRECRDSRPRPALGANPDCSRRAPFADLELLPAIALGETTGAHASVRAISLTHALYPRARSGNDELSRSSSHATARSGPLPSRSRANFPRAIRTRRARRPGDLGLAAGHGPRRAGASRTESIGYCRDWDYQSARDHADLGPQNGSIITRSSAGPLDRRVRDV